MDDTVKITCKLKVSFSIGPHVNLKAHTVILYSHKTNTTWNLTAI